MPVRAASMGARSAFYCATCDHEQVEEKNRSMCLYSESLRDVLSTVSCVFFFQAEDGIRDLTVTGVQTCALPIYRRPAPVPQRRRGRHAQAHEGAAADGQRIRSVPAVRGRPRRGKDLGRALLGDPRQRGRGRGGLLLLPVGFLRRREQPLPPPPFLLPPGRPRPPRPPPPPPHPRPGPPPP